MHWPIEILVAKSGVIIPFCTPLPCMSSKEAEKVPVPSKGGEPKDDKPTDPEGNDLDVPIQTLDEGDIAILRTYVRALNQCDY